MSVLNRPEIEGARSFLETLLARHRDQLAFVVLFGSRASDDWLPGSDYDVLVGFSADDDRRFIDRVATLAPDDGLDVEVFPYGRSDWRHMFETYHPLFLEALENGIILYDDGSFGEMHDRFLDWRKEGRVRPYRQGWKIAAP